MNTYILEYQTDRAPGMIRYVKFACAEPAWVYYDAKLYKDYFTFVKIYTLGEEVAR